MKLRSANSAAHASHCVRCEVPLTEAVGQVRATCLPCAKALTLMHAYSEYTMYRRTYYMCSTEGTSYQWLLDNGYGKEISLFAGLPRSAPMDQAKANTS